MLLLHRVSFYAADALSLVYFMETFKLDRIQHAGKPIAAAAGSSGVYIEPIQVSDCKEFNRGFIFFPSEVSVSIQREVNGLAPAESLS